MDRQNFIGGTDAIRIMNGEWSDLYQEKLGIVEPEDLSESLPVQLGMHTEQFNLDWWVQSYSPGYQMAGTERELQHEFRYDDGYVPLKGTADMMCIDSANKSYMRASRHRS